MPVRGAIATLMLFLVGCGSPVPSASRSPSAAGSRVAPAIPLRPLTTAISREPPSLDPSFINGANNNDFIAMGTGFLAYITEGQQPKPYLAESLPTLENGAWKLLPDGRMETTYALKPTAKWHDGQPITARDFLFFLPGSDGPGGARPEQ